MKKNKILIVDDNKLNRQSLADIFRKAYQIVESEDGKKALEYLKKDKGLSVAAIILDLIMPVMDGFSATCDIRRLSSDVPILALSAFAFDKEKEKAKDCQFDDYLVKPVDIPLLKYKIKYYLNKNKEKI